MLEMLDEMLDELLDAFNHSHININKLFLKLLDDDMLDALDQGVS